LSCSAALCPPNMQRVSRDLQLCSLPDTHALTPTRAAHTVSVPAAFIFSYMATVSAMPAASGSRMTAG
jgi:hypothetical protein